MQLPDMNTRPLKRLPNGHFTAERLSGLSDDPSLCRYCGRIDCPLRGRIERAAGDYARVAIRTCAAFVPALGFSVTQGLDLPRWNTVRIGGAWASRLRKGDRVAIIDSKAGAILRHMRVAYVECGKMERTLRDHALDNHAIQAKGISDRDQAATELRRILRSAYGTRIAGDDRSATAIGLED